MKTKFIPAPRTVLLTLSMGLCAGLMSAGLTACSDAGSAKNKQPEISAQNKTQNTVNIPNTHKSVFKAFDLASSGRPEDFLKASLLLERTGAHPMNSDDDLAQVWQNQALALKPELAKDAVPYRGRVKGPAYREYTLAPAETDTIREVYYAAEPASLSLDPRAGLVSFSVKETNATEPVCDTPKSSVKSACEWLPLYTAPYTISVTNESAAPLTYLLVSN